jgi:hypothetical protein
VGLDGEQPDDQREADVVAASDLVEERLVRVDDEVKALQRVPGDGQRV